MELFLVDEEDCRFKATVMHEPYFFLVPEDRITETGTYDGGGGATDNGGLDDGGSDDGGSDDGDMRLRYGDFVAAASRWWGPRGLSRAEVLRRWTLTRPTTWGDGPGLRGAGPCSRWCSTAWTSCRG